MSANLPKLDSRYGAPMGRANTLPHDFAGIIFLSAVRINGSGYDSGGAYWGLGQPLFQAAAHGADGAATDQAAYFRARDRKAALQRARDNWPAAKVR